jgi:YebC/PmpR family DNA-binding regulatory protein
MSGHSKWHSIKHKKAATDAKRGRIFTRLLKEISVAARHGGGDLNANSRLRTVVATAKAANMPADNIKKAIQRGTGELPGVVFEEVTYEAYGPGGVAIYLEVVSDNKNRTVAELRHVVSKHGGNLAESGSVAWIFHKKGYFVIDKSQGTEEQLMELALDAGADDLREEEGNYEVYSAPDSFYKVKEALEKKSIQLMTSEISMVPQTLVKLEGKSAQQMLKLMESLEDHEDVQHVWANFDISAEEMEMATA